jgi:hypothetical protein
MSILGLRIPNNHHDSNKITITVHNCAKSTNVMQSLLNIATGTTDIIQTQEPWILQQRITTAGQVHQELRIVGSLTRVDRFIRSIRSVGRLSRFDRFIRNIRSMVSILFLFLFFPSFFIFYQFIFSRKLFFTYTQSFTIRHIHLRWQKTTTTRFLFSCATTMKPGSRT